MNASLMVALEDESENHQPPQSPWNSPSSRCQGGTMDALNVCERKCQGEL